MLLRLRDQAQQALSRHGHAVASHQPSPPLTQQTPNNETQNDFNVVNSLGQLMRKGAEGKFGYMHQPISHFLDNTPPVAPRRINPSRPTGMIPESVFSPSMFAPVQTSQPLQHEQSRESNSGINPQNTIGDVTLGSTSPATSSDYIHPCPQSTNCPPPPSGSGEAPDCTSNDGQGINEPLPPSLMQVDANLYPPMVQAQGMDERLYNPPQAGPSYGDDAFEAFANYMNVDASVSSSDPSYPFMQPGSHLEQNAYPASLPALFPTSDFDVTFDMRASTGEDNITSMLPQDLEAWRTILHDSRYFGFADTESVKEPS